MSQDNLRHFAISNSPGTSGNITVGAAADAFSLTLGAAQDGRVYDAQIYETGVGAEIRTGCTYTHGTTTLTRGTLETSTGAGALNFTSAAKVRIINPASAFSFYDALLQATTPGGRLTTESGVPISTSDRTAQSTLYYTPFVHDRIVLWNGTLWAPTAFTEVSIALSGLTSGRPYDVFGFLSGGALALELLAWTNDTTRATAVTLQDGRYCKSGDKTRLLLGTIYTTSPTTTEDSLVRRYVCNIYNTVLRPMFSLPGGSNSTTSTSGIQYSNAGAVCRIDAVISRPGGQAVPIGYGVGGLASTVTGDTVRTAMVRNSTTSGAATDITMDWPCPNANSARQAAGNVNAAVTPGLNYWTAIFQRLAGSGTVTIANPNATGGVAC